MEIDKFKEYQIYLLLSGKFILITDVQPSNKMHASEKDRRCHFVYGKSYTSKSQLLSNTMIVNDKNTANSMVFDCDKIVGSDLAFIRNNEARYIGTLTDEKIKQFSQIRSVL